VHGGREPRHQVVDLAAGDALGERLEHGVGRAARAVSVSGTLGYPLEELLFGMICANRRSASPCSGSKSWRNSRSRIAQDLRDGALQGLTHALAVTGLHATGRDDEVHAILQHVGRQLRAAIYDPRLEENGERAFSDALRELVEVSREMTPGCCGTLETAADLPGGSFGRRGTEVLRIISEALTNACRHAGAQRIAVRVTGPETRLVAEVTDDGRGFDPPDSPGTTRPGFPRDARARRTPRRPPRRRRISLHARPRQGRPRPPRMGIRWPASRPSTSSARLPGRSRIGSTP